MVYNIRYVSVVRRGVRRGFVRRTKVFVRRRKYHTIRRKVPIIRRKIVRCGIRKKVLTKVVRLPYNISVGDKVDKKIPYKKLKKDIDKHFIR